MDTPKPRKVGNLPGEPCGTGTVEARQPGGPDHYESVIEPSVLCNGQDRNYWQTAATLALNGATMKRKAFTLVELLIVVVVIGILAAIGIPKFANSKSKAYVTAMKSDLRNLVNSEEGFFSDSARYTANLISLNFKASTGVVAPTITTYPGAWTATNAHTQLAAINCGIAANTTNPLIVSAGDGEPACK